MGFGKLTIQGKHIIKVAQFALLQKCGDPKRQLLDFLTTSLRNVPARHRSMWVVFEHSWRLLTDEEQLVLQRLAVFRGGFQQDAAIAVANAPLCAAE